MARIKKPKVPVIRKPLSEEQVTRSLRELGQTISAVADALFVQPHVELIVDQVGSQAVYRLEITDNNSLVTNVEYQILVDPEVGWQGWTSAWDTSVGVIGADTELIREQTEPLQEGHNTAIASRVQFEDVDGELRYIYQQHSFDLDQIAEIQSIVTSFESGVITIQAAGDEDTKSLWMKVQGAADGTASQFATGRRGDTTVLASGVLQREIAGKNAAGQFGPWVLVDLDTLLGTKTITFAGGDLNPLGSVTEFATQIPGGWRTPSAAGVGTSQFFIMSVVVPDGAVITKVEIEFFRANTSSVCEFEMYSNASLITSGAASGTGTITVTRNISHTYNKNNKTYVIVELKSNSLSDDARFGRCTFTYNSAHLMQSL